MRPGKKQREGEKLVAQPLISVDSINCQEGSCGPTMIDKKTGTVTLSALTKVGD